MTLMSTELESHPDQSELELDLHDNTIQALFGLGLKLEYCIQLIDSAPEQVKGGLEGVILNLDALIEQLRGRIYQLD
jgi:signal transduction histidine kinase